MPVPVRLHQDHPNETASNEMGRRAFEPIKDGTRVWLHESFFELVGEPIPSSILEAEAKDAVSDPEESVPPAGELDEAFSEPEFEPEPDALLQNAPTLKSIADQIARLTEAPFRDDDPVEADEECGAAGEPLESLGLIGAAMRLRLGQLGFHTIGDLAAADAHDLRHALGSLGTLAKVEDWIIAAKSRL